MVNEELLARITQEIDAVSKTDESIRGLKILYTLVQMHEPVPNMIPNHGDQPAKVESFTPQFSDTPACSCGFYAFPCPTLGTVYTAYN